MRRRDFIKAVISSAAVWPVTARAQPAILKALGISVPPSMQARADEMIE